MIKAMTTVLTSLLLMTGPGCLAMHKPATQMSYGPFGFSYKDTKDNNVTIEGLEVDPENKIVKLGKFEYVNDASTPMQAWVGQMEAQADLNRVTIEAMGGVIDRLAALIPTLPPVVRAVKGTDYSEQGVPQDVPVDSETPPSIVDVIKPLSPATPE